MYCGSILVSNFLKLASNCSIDSFSKKSLSSLFIESPKNIFSKLSSNFGNSKTLNFFKSTFSSPFNYLNLKNIDAPLDGIVMNAVTSKSNYGSYYYYYYHQYYHYYSSHDDTSEA